MRIGYRAKNRICGIESLENRRLFTASMLKDIVAGSGSSSPYEFAAAGSRVVFAANSAAGTDLYQTDGTPANTSLVKDFSGDLEGGSGGFRAYIASLNGYAYFFANDGVHGFELWRSDGTPAGTTLFDDIQPGGSTSSSVFYISNPGDPFARPDAHSRLTRVGNKLFFFANDGTHGFSLWTTDGTIGGTAIAKQGAFMPEVGISGLHLADLNGLAIFETLFNNADQLWRSDGTADGTFSLGSVTGASGQFPSPPVVSGGEFYYTSKVGTVNRLFETDGSVANTRAVPGTATLDNPYGMADINGTLYFGATSGTTTELWKTDGVNTTLVTNSVKPTQGASTAQSTGDNNWAAFAGGYTVFLGKSGSSMGLYRTDGTAAGTQKLTDLDSQFTSPYYYLFSFNGVAYLGNSTLVATDGSAVTTFPSFGLSPGSIINNVVYSLGVDSTHGFEPWKLTDDFAPLLYQAKASLGAAHQSVAFNFDENIGTSLTDVNVSVLNLANNTSLAAGAAHISFDPATLVATLTFPGLPNQRLSDGHYRVTIDKTGVNDIAGNAMAANFTFDFTFRVGDANHDGSVNIADFNTLAGNFGKSGMSFDQGDFNYDGVVNLLDLNVVATNFGKPLASALSVEVGGSVAPAAKVASSGSLFQSDKTVTSVEQDVLEN